MRIQDARRRHAARGPRRGETLLMTAAGGASLHRSLWVAEQVAAARLRAPGCGGVWLYDGPPLYDAVQAQPGNRLSALRSR